MKLRHSLTTAIAVPAVLLSLSVFATGNHAAGYSHDDEAIGKAGVATKVTRTVNVEMLDAMRYNPSSVAVRQGETIRFVIKNRGQITHEMVLGTEKELKEHYELMKQNPEMEHADANMLTLKPETTGEIIWQFTKAGPVNFACLQPGHYDAGMKGVVRVASGKGISKNVHNEH